MSGNSVFVSRFCGDGTEIGLVSDNESLWWLGKSCMTGSVSISRRSVRSELVGCVRGSE